MNILKHIKILLPCVMLLAVSCAKDNDADVAPSENEIRLKGISTRVGSGASNELDVNFTAFLDSDPSVRYVPETKVYSPGGLANTPQDLVFPNVNPHYPLGGVALRLFAYSGTADSNGNITLTSGTTTATRDQVISNNGYTVSQGVIDESNEGKGTLGSSADPAELMRFRHVMTKLTVTVRVDDTEDPDHVDPVPDVVEFALKNIIYGKGSYSIYAKPTDVAANPYNDYVVKKGKNYLVPTGANLAGKKFSSLRIDDYTATAEDLNNFVIAPLGSDTEMLLMPGYAYNLVITVQRLKVTGITLNKVDWNTEVVDQDYLVYNPKELALNIGDYQITDSDDEIEKIVLHTTDDKMYVGKQADNSTAIHFITLPPAGTVDSVDLYTPNGLMLSCPIQLSQYDETTLNIPMSIGGMLRQDPLSPNGSGNPYLVTTAVQFLNVSKEPSAHYKQIVKIDMEALINDDMVPFTGFPTFSGVYDGNGQGISNLDIQGPGLFNINSGIIRNVRVCSGSLDASGQTNAGFICGQNSGYVVACFNYGSIMTAGNYSGGICGENSGYIIACVNAGNIHAGAASGGICGNNTNTADGTITACVNVGIVTRMASPIGGIVGQSVATPNEVVRTGYWLVGTSEIVIGSPEYAVGSRNTGVYQTGDLSPEMLMDIYPAGQEPPQTTVELLNAELAGVLIWSDMYEFVIDRVATGSVWPVPVLK